MLTGTWGVLAYSKLNKGQNNNDHTARYTMKLSMTLRCIRKRVATKGMVDVSPTMIAINGAAFQLIDENGQPYQQEAMMHLSPYYIYSHEVTQQEYQSIMNVNPSVVVDGDKYPVRNISWFRAIVFCNKKSIAEGLRPCYQWDVDGGSNPDNWPLFWELEWYSGDIWVDVTANGYRLPTEMEWMYAAMSANGSFVDPYSGGADINAVAWHSGNAQALMQTGKKTPNARGIYDMSGNVAEMCFDIYNATYRIPGDGYVINAGLESSRPGTTCVVRGGSYADGDMCKVYKRTSISVSAANANNGFRYVKQIPVHIHDVASYTYAQSVSTYEEITGGTELAISTTNMVFNKIDIGFVFRYDTINYAKVSIAENGFIAMGDGVSSTTLPLSSSTGTNNVIAVCARSIIPVEGSGVISHKTIGDAPNREFVVQWKNFRRSPSTCAIDIMNFQIRLLEGTNQIVLSYGSFTLITVGTAATVQVGLRGQTSATYNNRTTANNWSATTAGTANNANCRIEQNIKPQNGLKFVYTPVLEQ